jgi:hypothetical protein
VWYSPPRVATQGANLSTPITKAAWHTKPSWFVISSNDRMIAPEQEISTAKRMNAKTLTLPTSHVPMLTQPQKVADFLIEAAAVALPPSVALLRAGNRRCREADAFARPGFSDRWTWRNCWRGRLAVSSWRCWRVGFSNEAGAARPLSRANHSRLGSPSA